MAHSSTSIRIEIVKIFSGKKRSEVKAVKFTIERILKPPEIHLIELDILRQASSNERRLLNSTASNAVCHNLYNLLTNREQEIVSHVAAGKSSLEIADVLFVSVNTVKNHRRNIKRKLDLYDPIFYSKFLKWIAVGSNR